MKIYPCLFDREGKVAAFEVDGVYIGKSDLHKVLSGIPGVTEVNVSRREKRDRDVRATFEYRGSVGVVMEPFSDNSRLWIGSEGQADDPPSFEEIADAFGAFRPSVARAVVGDLLHLRVFFPTVRRQ